MATKKRATVAVREARQMALLTRIRDFQGESGCGEREALYLKAREIPTAGALKRRGLAYPVGHALWKITPDGRAVLDAYRLDAIAQIVRNAENDCQSLEHNLSDLQDELSDDARIPKELQNRINDLMHDVKNILDVFEDTF